MHGTNTKTVGHYNNTLDAQIEHKVSEHTLCFTCVTNKRALQLYSFTALWRAYRHLKCLSAIRFERFV